MRIRYLILPMIIATPIIAGTIFLTKVSAASCTQTVTNANASGAGSLISAVANANSNSNVDVICFNISGNGTQTIMPTSAVLLSQPATIDGTTQPGYSGQPLIEISGQNISGSGTPDIWITGGNSTVRGLVINRSKGNGIIMTNGNGNTIVGNYIGTDVSGTIAAPNAIDGVGTITANNIIGGTTAADRNVISGNTGNGVGITNQAAQNNVVQGNYIGTSKDGTAAIPNNGDGLLINNSTNNIVGGTASTTPGGACNGACNVLSGNTHNGIGVYLANSNTVQGNYIGSMPNGTTRLPNGDIGIELQEAANNTVGSGTAAGRNVISGNMGAGMLLTGAGTTGDTVKGNYIGMDTTGITPLGNQLMGISIGNSPGLGNGYARNNIIGGTIDPNSPSCQGNCNLISGNAQNGIIISGGSGVGNFIQGNYIGVKVDGNGENGGVVGNGLDGIGILNSPNNFVGTSSDTSRNIVTGNKGNGVIVAGDPSTGNRVEHNYVGLSHTSDSSALKIGNKFAGVTMSGGVSTAILGNEITSNGGFGIDVGYNGVTQNDSGDGDGGVNNQQNFPNVYSAKDINSGTTISGVLNTNSNTQYELDFFDSSGCNSGKPDNYGEGDSFIGKIDTATDQFGNISFSFATSTQLPGNSYVNATATRKIGNVPAETSEFSKCVLVNTSKPLVTNGATWSLKDDLTSGGADETFGYGFPSYLLFCAWDPSKPGMKLPVVVSTNGTWFFRASYTTGTADLVVQYGFPGGRPVCGDWDGDGVDTVGWVGQNLTWYLKNANTNGTADITFQYGPAGQPIVGDWDGDGHDGVGVFTPDGHWSLRNATNSGTADYYFQYGAAGSQPVVGDWDGNRTDTIGTYSPSSSYWSLRSDNSSGPATTSFTFGGTGTTAQTW